MVLVMAYATLRIGEAAGLRRTDVDVVAGTLRVVNNLVELRGQLHEAPPKTDAGRRTMSLPTSVVADLAVHLERFPGEVYVFPEPNGGPLDPSVWRTSCWYPAVRAAGLRPLRLHDLMSADGGERSVTGKSSRAGSPRARDRRICRRGKSELSSLKTAPNRCSVAGAPTRKEAPALAGDEHPFPASCRGVCRDQPGGAATSKRKFASPCSRVMRAITHGNSSKCAARSIAPLKRREASSSRWPTRSVPRWCGRCEHLGDVTVKDHLDPVVIGHVGPHLLSQRRRRRIRHRRRRPDRPRRASSSSLARFSGSRARAGSLYTFEQPDSGTDGRRPACAHRRVHREGRRPLGAEYSPGPRPRSRRCRRCRRRRWESL
jgi:hypothetical protein